VLLIGLSNKLSVTRLWFDFLDNPPKPNANLIAAAKALLANEEAAKKTSHQN
jgi:hypothetical protein